MTYSTPRGKLALAVTAAVLLLGGAGAGVWALTKGTPEGPSTQSAASGSPWDALSESDRAQFRTAFLTGMEQSGLPIDWTAASADCLGSRLVNAIGEEKLKGYVLSNPAGSDFAKHPMSASDAAAMANAIVACAPHDGAITYFKSKFDEGLGASATAAQASCMHDHLGRQIWIDLLASEYDGESTAAEATLQDKARAAAKICLT